MLVCNKHSSAAAKESETKTTRRGEKRPQDARTHTHTHTHTISCSVIHSTNHKPNEAEEESGERAAKLCGPVLASPPLPQPGAGGICQSSGRQPTNTSPVMQPNGIELQCRGRIWMPIFAEYTGSCVAKPPTTSHLNAHPALPFVFLLLPRPSACVSSRLACRMHMYVRACTPNKAMYEHVSGYMYCTST
jgi:hypothetical protein